MSKRSIVFLALLILAPVIIYFLWPSDESRIKKLFREGAKAVEEKKTEDVMSKISFNYTDSHGITYIILKDVLTKTLSRMSNIKIEYEITKMDIKDEKASAELDLRAIATSGNDTGYFIGDAAKPAHVKFSLEKERTKWLITSTEGIYTGM